MTYPMSSQLEINKLVRQILDHDYRYWVLNDPIISDPEYDELTQALSRLSTNHPVLHQVHRAVVPRGTTVRHATEMLSLAKAYTTEEVLKWAQGVSRNPLEVFRISIKFDGVASEYLPAAGVLSTAGDNGWDGEDISDKLPIVDFSATDMSAITPQRGELVVLKSVLPSLRRSEGSTYKTERAAAVGLLNADATDRGQGRVIKFMPHSFELRRFTLEELSKVNWESLAQTVQQGDIPADGLVIALFDLEYAATLGQTEHHPRHSIALKFANPTAISKLIAVEWQCGKFGLTPVGILEPVVISGCTHDRVSLHNLDQIRALDLHIGDKVEVERCGDVIPQIKRVIKKGAGPIVVPPEKCPACDTRLYVDGGLKCPNITCGGTAAKRLLDALSRVGVENIGPGVASALVAAGFSRLQQVFEMTYKDWLSIEGFADKSVKQMVRQFSLLMEVTDYQLLAAMNIEGIGLSLAKKICAKLNPASATIEQLVALEGIGLERATRIQRDFDGGLWAWALGELQVQFTQGLADRPTVCFTGADATGRDAWVKLAEAAGYVYSKTVNKKLTVLVASRTDSTKAKKAAEYGTRVINYEQFREELNNGSTKVEG